MWSAMRLHGLMAMTVDCRSTDSGSIPGGVVFGSVTERLLYLTVNQASGKASGVRVPPGPYFIIMRGVLWHAMYQRMLLGKELMSLSVAGVERS